jgi:hypothetical protein
MFALATSRRLAVLSLSAVLLFGATAVPAAPAASAQYSDAQLRLLYDEAAATGSMVYSFYIFATKDADAIQEAHKKLMQPGLRDKSLKSLFNLNANMLVAFVLPAPVREQLNHLSEGSRSAPFQLADGSWAMVELESVDALKQSMPGFEQLRGRLPGLVASGALPTPDALRNDPALVARTLINKVDSAKSFDQLPPGVDVDHPLSNGYMLLQQALLRDDAGLVTALLKRRTNPNLCPMRACPLQLALQSKTHAADYVKQLLEAGAQPDQIAAPDADTALTLASLEGNAAAVQLLLEKGADINGGNGPRQPLTVAIHRGHSAVSKLLLDKGADPLFRKTPAGGMASSSATAMSVALQQGKAEGAMLRSAVMKKFSTLPQHQWSGWIEQDGEKLPLADGTLHLKRKPFTLALRMPVDGQMRLASSSSTRIFDEIRTSDLAAAVYQLDKPGVEPRDGSARWLLVSNDINPAGKAKRPPATQTWLWSGLRQDFNRRDKAPQGGDVFLREINAFMMAVGSGEYSRVAIEDSKLAEVNIVIGSAIDYDIDAGDFVNAHHIKLVFDR